ncbi:MAG: 16S rRNA (cytidine(1402)-2'-O)-methyltransferase [Bacillota bacterium]|nr:16S rRNA (cytidine(1402)-2'-O)-methyltransferase [Bacillota bacterium]
MGTAGSRGPGIAGLTGLPDSAGLARPECPARPARGTLYVCATPIGNLEDITMRALRVLREVDLVAAEDTRHTRKLLAHYDIPAKMVSYHEHNERSRAPEIIEVLLGGGSVALVTDAGTPVVSDPGAHLVGEAVAKGIPVVPVPGASAALAALVVSGFSTDEFTFVGFLPRKGKERREALERLAEEKRVVVLYESPYRVARTLADIAAAIGAERGVAVARELTKVHEEVVRGALGEVAALFAARTVKGEVTIVLDAPETPRRKAGKRKTGGDCSRETSPPFA